MAISRVVPVTGSGGGMTASPQGRSVHPQPTLNRLGPLPSGAKAFGDAIQPYLMMALKKQQAKQERERRSKAIQTSERTGDITGLDPDLYTDAKNRILKRKLLEEQIKDRQERQKQREVFERGILGSKQKQEVKVLGIKQRYKEEDYDKETTDWYKKTEFKTAQQMVLNNDAAGIATLRDNLIYGQKKELAKAKREGVTDLEELKNIHKTEQNKFMGGIRVQLKEMGIDSNEFMQRVGNIQQTFERQASETHSKAMQVGRFSQQDRTADTKYQRDSATKALDWDRKFEKQAITQEGLDRRAKSTQEGLSQRLDRQLSAKEKFAVNEWARKSDFEKFKAALGEEYLTYGEGGLTANQVMKRNDLVDQMNKIDTIMVDMETIMNTHGLVAGTPGKVRKFLEFFPKSVDLPMKFPASEFSYMRNMLSVLVSKPLMKESRLSDKERARVDNLVRGGGYFDTPHDVREAFKALKKVMSTARNRLKIGKGRLSAPETEDEWWKK
jgi:hypothetical protein